jgi:hypothetical protein
LTMARMTVTSSFPDRPACRWIAARWGGGLGSSR